MNPELESAPEVHKTGHRWIDLSVAGCALLVSFCSLGLAIHHGKIMERLVQANSLPFVQLTRSNAEPAGDGSMRAVMSFDLRNAGNGPARVELLQLSLDDKPVDNWSVLLEALRTEAAAAGKLDGTSVPIGTNTHSDVPVFMQPSSILSSLRWQRTAENAPLWDFVDGVMLNSTRLHAQACYCSIFDECWIADSNVFKPKPVEECGVAQQRAESR